MASLLLTHRFQKRERLLSCPSQDKEITMSFLFILHVRCKSDFYFWFLLESFCQEEFFFKLY